jgi:hypothetical protein
MCFTLYVSTVFNSDLKTAKWIILLCFTLYNSNFKRYSVVGITRLDPGIEQKGDGGGTGYMF